ncbi:unnamed protein product [Thelazia callipaeda]|uniref:Uncharacterized protein n=1 Tax=Thelazia callipaeda TaxID=103827 RepID=A0A0N5CKI5_THECL|nr:unnamed protein product [Thelazia callipaeda]
MSIYEYAGHLLAYANGPPSPQPYSYEIEYVTNKPNTEYNNQKQAEWNQEYNYGRNYKHSEGKEWGTGYNNRYSTGNDAKDEYQIMKILSPTSTMKNFAKEYSWIDSSFPITQISNSNLQYKSDNDFHQKTGSPIKHWYHWPSKNITWPNWVPIKGNNYVKQPAPWWNLGTQQTNNAPELKWFGSESDDNINNKKVKGNIIRKQNKQLLWSGSVGWKGDLGGFGEIPSPPWVSTPILGRCC